MLARGEVSWELFDALWSLEQSFLIEENADILTATIVKF